jgi:NADPH:quinone reductase-like Zn-dependent oxidoreductase
VLAEHGAQHVIATDETDLVAEVQRLTNGRGARIIFDPVLKSLSIRGWVASFIWSKPERFARNHDLILRGLASGHLKPVIARTFPLSQIVEAHRYLESNQQVGKVVVTV